MLDCTTTRSARVANLAGGATTVNAETTGPNAAPDRRHLLRLGGLAAAGASAAAIAVAVDGTAAAAATPLIRTGVVTVPAGRHNVTVVVPGGLKATSRAFATLQEIPANGYIVSVMAAVPNPTTGKLRIELTGNVPTGTDVGWFVIG